MFTLQQVTDIHDLLGTSDNLPAYLHALHEVGVETYDSFITDGHSVYRGKNGHTVTTPAYHDTFAVAETGDKKQFLHVMQRVEQGKLGYDDMSKALADAGVYKWTFDTSNLTMAYYDKAGTQLLLEHLA